MSGTVRDRALVAVCTVLQVFSIKPGPAAAASAIADSFATVAGALSGVALLGRRRAPLTVLGAVTAGYAGQAALAGAVLPVALAAAAYSAARHGPPLTGTLWAVTPVVAVTAALFVVGQIGVAPLYGGLLLAAALAGGLVAARAARQAALLREAAAEERLRIARDLHDIVGHGVGAITVQAGAGRMALDADAHDDVRRALLTIEGAGRNLLREVRWTVGLLRDEPGGRGLADLPALLDAARAAGLTVDADLPEPPPGLPAASQEAAYRIVQEALTNVVRHSSAPRCAVRVAVTDALRVEVRDEGEPVTTAAEGHGLRGMRERAATVGGELRAGPAADGTGWTVAAELPLGRRAR